MNNLNMASELLRRINNLNYPLNHYATAYLAKLSNSTVNYVITSDDVDKAVGFAYSQNVIDMNHKVNEETFNGAVSDHSEGKSIKLQQLIDQKSGADISLEHV